nr:MAG TPA: hypothetical protein [Caudoviricetes sp.]
MTEIIFIHKINNKFVLFFILIKLYPTFSF